MHKSFQTPQPVAITVRLVGGDLTVEATDTAETEVDLEPRNAHAERLLDQVRVEHRGPALIIEVPKALGSTLELGVSVRCPRSSSLEAETASADIRTIGPLARLDITTASGDVQVEEVTGKAEVTTASGDVALGVVAGRAAVISASGDVHIQRASSGLRVVNASGDLQADDVEGDVRADAASGDLRLDAVGPGDVRVRSGSGDVYVGVKPGCDVWMDIQTLSGEASSELEASEKSPADRSRLVELRINTASGDVRIARALAHARP
jgi:DUF4097 and DUF4098 domain-containing protein YvlB